MEPGSHHRPTLQAIAREVGVSVMTVSRALGGKPKVSEALRRRIVDTATRLGYVRADPHARALRTRRSQLVGVVMHDLVNPYFSELARAIDDQLRAYDYISLTGNCDNDPQRTERVIDSLAATGVDALICTFYRPGLPSWDGRTPRVWIGYEGGGERPPGSAVALDLVTGTQAAVRQLLDLGHRRIAHLSADGRGGRCRAYVAAMRAAGQEPIVWAYGDHPHSRISQQERARRYVAERLSDAPERPTAVMAHDDLMALTVIQAAQACGLIVPAELSVFGTDDTEPARMVAPQLSTLRIPIAPLGRLAALLALRRLGLEVDAGIERQESEAGATQPEPGLWSVRAEPVWRGSSGLAPEQAQRWFDGGADWE